MKTKYNKNQIKAIEYPVQPLLILAGAGTGKTTTIIGRMAYLIHKMHAVPESILALTFTNDSADHLKQKLIAEIGEIGSRINACTFHSFAQTIIFSYYNELGYTEPPLIMNKGDMFFLLRLHFNKIHRLRSTLFRRDPLKAIQSFQKVFDAFRQNLLSQSELISLQQKELNRIKQMVNKNEIESIYQLADMVDIYPLYQNWKKEANWINYSVDDSTGTHLALIDASDNTVGYFIFGRSKTDWAHNFVRVRSDNESKDVLKNVYETSESIIHHLNTSVTYWGENPPIKELESVEMDSLGM